MMEGERKFDLVGRTIEYAVGICRLYENMRKRGQNVHIADQMMRSGTAVAANYAEATAAESSDDFVHKMRICLKELNEALTWLRIIAAMGYADAGSCSALGEETKQLIRIFSASIHTVRHSANSKH